MESQGVPQAKGGVPEEGGSKLNGIQHKYNKTVLVFPFQGQTCHAYSTYCFRWAQFGGADNLRSAAKDVEALIRYLENNAKPPASRVVVHYGRRSPGHERKGALERERKQFCKKVLDSF